MKIVIAKTAGFCMGVKRAVDLAIDSSSEYQKEIYTLGPLIHNSQTLEMLKERNVFQLDEAKIINKESPLLIRAHGVPPETEKKFKDLGYNLIDGTCPRVKTVHRVIEKYKQNDFAIVITGDTGHAEVIGLLGYAGNLGFLIQKEEDIEKLPDFKKVCLVSQTTFDMTLFDAIAKKLKARYLNSEVVIKKTICSATEKRQKETKEIALQVDLMIVVGDKNSANSKRLAQIASAAGKPTIFVETEQNIKWEQIQNANSIGITAGASTPHWMIKRVADQIQFLMQTQRKTFKNIILKIFDGLANLNIFVSFGSIFVYAASCYIQGFNFSTTGAIIAFLYFLSMYHWNSLTSIEVTQHLSLSRYRFYQNHKKLLFIITSALIVFLLAFSFIENKTLFYLMLFSTMSGTVYYITIVPVFIQSLFRYKKLKDIPTSRDLFVALAWAIVLTFIPHAMNNSLEISITSVFTFLFIFFVAYLRSLIFDLRDIEGDRIMGRETLITIIGEKKVRKFINYFIWIIVGLLAFIPIYLFILKYNQYNKLCINMIFQIPIFIYIFIFMKIGQHKRITKNFLFSFFADFQFYIAGIFAWFASLLLY